MFVFKVGLERSLSHTLASSFWISFGKSLSNIMGISLWGNFQASLWVSLGFALAGERELFEQCKALLAAQEGALGLGSLKHKPTSFVVLVA